MERRQSESGKESEACEASAAKREENGENNGQRPSGGGERTASATPARHAQALGAAESGDCETLRKLLRREPHLAHVVDDDGYTPLHRASYGNHCEVIKLLLDYGVNVNATTNDGWRPLHCAARWGHTGAASLLLDNGADVNAVTNGGITALHLAAGGGNKRLLELLLYHPDIETETKNASGDTAYDIAYRSSPLYKLFQNLV
ncbi:Ankyrin repeat domain-containing protein 49-like protein [Dinothrombium tinctorium]|uniref:Alpha-latrotoxin n=1 Tax=Dinothrombium tinctorium TaxID=1965070 RepID=A0A443RPJ3_9ACAR|nr:Ankyrin repeat domain-containing protein 49-like protein [Dinothrombium tinctorium]